MPAIQHDATAIDAESFSRFLSCPIIFDEPDRVAVDAWRGDPQADFYDEAVVADWSEYHDRRFSGLSRLVRSTFAEAVEHFPDRSVNLLHIDGYPTFDAISAHFQLWRSKVSGRRVFLIHDINVREREFGA